MELYSWPPGLGQHSFDPKCLAIQTLLNLTNADWVVHECQTSTISPSGDLPVLKIGIEPTTGTFNIIKVLKSQGFDLDLNLTPMQQVETTAYITLLETKFYEAMLYSWWVEEANFVKSMAKLTRKLDFLNQRWLPNQMRDRVVTRVKSEMIGDIPRVYVDAKLVLKELNDKLTGDFFFDAIVYGYLALASYPSLAEPTLFSMLTFEFPKLVAFCARIQPMLKTPKQSPHKRPSLLHLIKDIGQNPLSYFEYCLGGFQTKLVHSSERKTKEERVERFFKYLSVIGAFGFFCSYIATNGIIRLPIEDVD